MNRQFPYTNFHDLNLDWIIEKIKEVLAIIEEFKDLVPTVTSRINSLERKVMIMQGQIAAMGGPEPVDTGMVPGDMQGSDGLPLNEYNFERGSIAIFGIISDTYKVSQFQVRSGQNITVYGLDPTAEVIQVALTADDTELASVWINQYYSGGVDSGTSTSFIVPENLTNPVVVCMVPQSQPDIIAFVQNPDA